MAAIHPVMIVEQDCAIQDFLEMALTAENYAVVTVPDCQQAFQILRLSIPCLVLLDMHQNMTILTEFVAECRMLAHPPTLLGMGTSLQLRTAAETMGLTDFLMKPFDLNELLLCITQHC